MRHRSPTTQYNRHGLGQTTHLISPDTGTTLSKSGSANQSYNWTYDQTGGFYTSGIGRLTSLTYPEGSNSFAYDPLGRLTQTRQVITPNASGNPLAVVQYTSYAYDSTGHLASMVYPSGRTLSFAYANGLPTGLSLAANSASAATPLVTNLQFAPFGGPKSWNWVMNSGVNGGSVPHARSFDLNGRLTRYPLGEHLRDVTYDAAGRITAYTHYLAASGATTGSSAPAQNQQFSYDALERLTQATTSQASWTYTYDANGNRTSVKVNSGTPNAYTVSPTSNRLSNIASPAITLTHDAMGNIVSDGTYTLTYDLRGRLTTTTQGGITTTYAYDNNGQRVRKFNNQGTQNTVLFVYDQQNQLLGEYDSAGQAIREYVWLGNMPVAMFTPDPSQGANAATAAPLVYYIHADHIDTPRVVVDKTNTMRWRWMGEPFGTQAPETSPAGQAALTFNLRFPGQFFDVESGMFYNAQRDYIPGIGRYGESDPIGLTGGINTYGYSGANPVSNSDPTGEAFNLRGILNIVAPPVPAPVPVPLTSPNPGPSNPEFPPGVGPNGGTRIPNVSMPTMPAFTVPIVTIVTTVGNAIAQSCGISRDKAQNMCQAECSFELDFPGRQDNFGPYRACIRKCLAKYGFST